MPYKIHTENPPTRNVLLVDGTIKDLNSLTRHFQKVGFEVTKAVSLFKDTTKFYGIKEDGTKVALKPNDFNIIIIASNIAKVVNGKIVENEIENGDALVSKLRHHDCPKPILGISENEADQQSMLNAGASFFTIKEAGKYNDIFNTVEALIGSYESARIIENQLRIKPTRSNNIDENEVIHLSARLKPQQGQKSWTNSLGRMPRDLMGIIRGITSSRPSNSSSRSTQMLQTNSGDSDSFKKPDDRQASFTRGQK